MEEIFLKSLEDMNMYDPPLMGIFEYNKTYTAYSLKVLAGIEVDDMEEMFVKVENFLAPVKNGRSMRMDARINLRGNIRADIEIQKVLVHIQVKMLRTEYWNTEAGSKCYYEKF